MKQELKQGAIFDFLTKSELDESIGHSFDDAIRDLYRGVDYLMFTGVANGENTFTIPYTPESGYTWSIKLIAAQLSGTSTAVVSVYPASTNTVAPAGVTNSIVNTPNNEAVLTWSSNQFVIKDSRGITLFCAAETFNNFLMIVEQVPSEMQGKL